MTAPVGRVPTETAMRRGLFGLPLQRSIFRRLGEMPELLGLSAAVATVLRARIDERGDLYVDRAGAEAMARVIADPSASAADLER
jgi:hypothetical protein